MNLFKKKITINDFKTYDHELNIYDFIDGSYVLTEDGINIDGSFNADGWSIRLKKKNNNKLTLIKIPWRFNIINGDFDISNNKVDTLYGSPKIVNGNFKCSVNNIKSLEFCPIEVSKSFKCYNNMIKDMEFSPKKVKDIFDISHNRLETINFNTEVHLFDCSNNNLKSLKGYSKNISFLKYHDNNELDITLINNNIDPSNRDYIEFSDKEFSKLVNLFPNVKYNILTVGVSKIYNSIYSIYKLKDDYYQINMFDNIIYVDQFSSLISTLKKINNLL